MESDVFFLPARGSEGDKALAEKAEKIFLKTGFLSKIEKDSFIACKIHFGDKGNRGHINPFWLSGIINHLKRKTDRVFFTDTNTLYSGKRSNSVEHLRLAWEHGFSLETVDIPVLIADGLIGHDEEKIQVNLPWIKSAKVASAFLHCDGLICLSHFTGHILTGFGAAIKNLGMGCASRAGKLEQHSDVHPKINPRLCKNCGICLDYCPAEAIQQEDGSVRILEEKCIGCGECLVVCPAGAVKMRWDADSRRVQEKMAEYAYSVLQKFKGKVGFLNFLIKVTKNCDCMAKNEPAIVEDIGIMASEDPVAIDQASVDLINSRSNKDLLMSVFDIDWSIQLRHGEKIGLGRRNYRRIEIG